MHEMHDRPPLFSSNRPHLCDFLNQGVILNSYLVPWFHVSIRVSDQNRVDERALMIPTFDGLKKVLKQQTHSTL